MELPIFGISGLRGIVGKDLSPERVAAVAALFGEFLGPGAVALGQDSRPTSPMLAGAAIAGLKEAGREVVELGVCPTPTVLHYVRRHGLAGGLVITASHNPAEWNGVKFVSSRGAFLFGSEFQRFKRLVEAAVPSRFPPSAFRFPPSAFRFPHSGAIAEHVGAIVQNELFQCVRERLAGQGLRVGIDAVNGAASVAAIELIRAFGVEPVPLFCEPGKAELGFPRGPEPIPDNLAELCRLVRNDGLAAGFAFDPDGDRFSCVDETGTPLGEEATVCLACRHVLARRRGPVVVNLSTSRAVDDICQEFGVKVERTAVGEARVVERMLELGAVVGGEGNGGAIVPSINLGRDGLVAAAVILAKISEMPLSQARLSLPVYHMVKSRVELNREEFSPRVERLVKTFTGAQFDRTDGLRIDGNDFWIHIRPSNTEPIVRIIVEAKTRAQAEGLAQEVRGALEADGGKR
ncbi:MAG: phosphoglucosamine mutase [candidate division WOR-3 bacterium]